MVDPESVVTEIVTVAQLIIRAASNVKQNKVKCLELADLAQTLSHASLAHANNAATVRVLERLRDAVDKALRLVCSCQSAVMFSGKKADELESVENRINNCIMYITFIRTGASTAHVGVPTPAAPAPYYPAAPAPCYPAAPAPYYPAAPAPCYPAAPAPYYPAAPAPYYPTAPAPYPAAPGPYYPAAPAPYYPVAPAPYPAAPAPYPCYSAPPDPSGFKL